jgi:hypothetical protein
MYYCQISVKLGFVDRFSKTTQIPNFKNIRSVRAEFFHEERHSDGRADGQNDMAQLIVAIRNYANARNKIHSPYPTVRGDAAINCEADYRNNRPYKSSN